MATYVSMLNWSGEPQPEPDDVRAAVGAQSYELRARGLHSLVFLPDKGVCAAIMIVSCDDDGEVSAIARDLLPEAEVRVDSMRFDDEPAMPAWIAREVVRPPEGDELGLIYRAVVGA